MVVRPGGTLSHYRIVAKIGEGGMGEVYVAEDTKLSRRVALKVLPPAVASDPERRGRFEREAKAVAALTHPNIVTIHSIEEADGVHFLTMELVDGKRLTDLLPKGGMGLSRLLEVGLAMTEAMSAAHRKEITHRDLKPDNIMVGEGGRLRILDFGLAKLKEETSGPLAGSHLPTRAVQTEDGRILGTVAYMSPEQAEGKPIGPRSDVFSIGIILYEMATGERPFKGDSRLSILSSILRDNPVLVTELNRELPRHLGRIIKRCLAKDPERRYGNARELYNDLLELKEEIDSGEIQPVSAAEGRPRRAGAGRRRMAPVAVGLAALAVAAAAVLLLRGRGVFQSPALPPIEADFTQLTQLPGEETRPSLSPDGRMLAFASRAEGDWDIYFQVVGGETTINLTEDSKADDDWPVFSPDGSRIAFVSTREGGGIFVMGSTGESVRRLTESGFSPAWSPDGKEVVFSSEGFTTPSQRQGTGELRVVNVETGMIREIPCELDAVQPAWSPHGRRIAFWGLRAGGGQRDIWTIPAAGGKAVEVTHDAPTDWDPVWSPDGRFLYFCSNRSGSMNFWRAPIDEESGRLEGPPQAVTTGVAGSTFLTIASDGKRMAYVSDEREVNLTRVAFNPAGATVAGEPAGITRGANILPFLSLSADGEWLVSTTGRGQEDLTLMRVEGTGRRQLTSDTAKDRGSVWSSDGTRIAFYSDRSGKYEIWTIHPDGSGLQQLTETGGLTLYPVWSPDGSRMAIETSVEKKETVVVFDPRRGWKDQTPETLPFFGSAEAYFEPWSWSPDGKWLAGTLRAGVTGTRGIALYSFESRQYRKLTDTGEYPNWLNDSRRLLFTHQGKIFVTDMKTGAVREIFSVLPDTIAFVRVSRDNHTLYFTRATSENDIWMITLK